MSTTTFLPWLRLGVAAFFSDNQPAASSLALAAQLLPSSGRPEDQVGLEIHVRGPGEVLGIDPRVIVREEPSGRADAASSTTFPHVEFREPDLPWRYSPVGADAQGRVPPWIVLVCVQVQDGVRLEWDHARKRALLHVRGDRIASELPALAEAWAWAHVQVAGTVKDEASLLQGLQERPGEVVARLVCPRRLNSFTSYICAVVPAFAVGVAAALGRPTSAGPLEPAWGQGAVKPTEFLTLPAYHSWRFTTGESGDFEDLAQRLRVREAPKGLGERKIALRLPPGAGFDVPATTVQMWGALRGTPAAGQPLESDTPVAVRAGLKAMWETPKSGKDEPTVTAPMYGADYDPTLKYGWATQLNLHPAHRVAAGLGAEIVRRHQEELVTAAWEQLEQARSAAALQQHTQLAVEVGRSWARRVAALEPATALQLSARTHGRTTDDRGALLRARLQADGLPGGALSRRLRRMLRPGAPTGRLLHRAASPDPAGKFVQQLLHDPGVMLRAAGWERPCGFEAVTSPAVDRSQLTAVETAPFQPKLRPRDVHVARFHERVSGGNSEVLRDGLHVMPEFAVPLARWLVEIDPNLLLPGLGEVPEDSIIVLEPNRAFVEAVIMGANDALTRELVWREFPVDRRGSAFRVFWDGADGHDVDALKRWNGGLGGHKAAPTDRPNEIGAGVLLRSALLRRYPDMRIYMARRVANKVVPSLPSAFGRMSEDTCYALFPLRKDELVAGGQPRDGWWLVLEQGPDSIRFGLDSPEDGLLGKVPTAGTGLSWAHFGATEDGPIKPTHVPAAPRDQWKGDFAAWGKDSGAIAKLTLQKRIRRALPLTSLTSTGGN